MLLRRHYSFPGEENQDPKYEVICLNSGLTSGKVGFKCRAEGAKA